MTFLTMANRIAAELRRSNLLDEIKNCINDAIAEEARQRYYFNELRGQNFTTVPGQEYYSDLGMTEIDSLYYLQGTTRYNLWLRSNRDADVEAEGNVSGGQLESFSRHAETIRLYPIPDQAYSVYMDGYGKLTPTPLVNDSDTNAWMTAGERLIRASAKAILLKDVIRDFGEAAAYEAIAQDLRNSLDAETNTRGGTGQLKGTLF